MVNFTKRTNRFFRPASIALLCFSLLFSYKVHAQCPSGGINIVTQAEADQFGVDYPNCTVINGVLSIGQNTGTTDIVDLSALANITNVTGTINISNNAFLPNVDALSNLTSIGGNLQFYGNTVLQNIDGLSVVEQIGGTITIDNNSNLQNLDGLNAVTQIGGAIVIINNSNLQNLDGLSALQSTGEDIYIIDNTSLSDISALANTTFVPTSGYGLTLTNNPLLTFCNLPNFCSYLANDPSTHPRSINGNGGNCLDEQTVFAACNPVATGCLDANATMPQWPSTAFTPGCTGFPIVIASDTWTGEYSKVLVTAGTEYTFSSSVPTDLVTIGDKNGTMVHVFGTETVTWTATVTDTIRFYLHLDDLCNYGDQINRSRIVKCGTIPQCPPGNVVLLSQQEVNQFLIDYPNCTHIVGNLDIHGTNITDLSPLNNLVSTGGELAIWNCTNLQSINGLINLAQIGGRIYIGGDDNTNTNSQLLNINGLSNVTSVGGMLAIKFCNALQNLNAFSQLTQIGGGLAIQNNTALNNITGFQNIAPNSIASFGLVIENNPLLSICDLPNICTYLTYDAGTHPRVIEGNASNCVNEQAVKAACVLDVDKMEDISFNLYPNPVEDVLNISTVNEIHGITVFNLLGQKVIDDVKLSNGQMNVSALYPGNYVCQVKLDNGTIRTFKLLKK